MRSDEAGTTIRLHMKLPRPRPRVRDPRLAAALGQRDSSTFAESAVWYNKGVDLLTVSVTARESAGEPYTLVEIAGEADVTNTDELRRLLDEEVSQQPRTLIIDLSGLRFMDSSALHALLRVNRSLDRQGGVLALVSPQPAVAKILRLTTADRLIPVFDSVAEAAVG